MISKRTVVGKFVHTTWGNLQSRCANGKYWRDTPKNRSYCNVLLLIEREDFKTWCWQQQNRIESLNRPSLDRIDSNKNYTIDNIQIIELEQNIAKNKLTFTDTHGRCFSCKKTKPIDDFARDNRRMMTGRTTICKICDNTRASRKYRSRNV